MVSFYNDGQRRLQEEFDTTQLADKLEEAIVRGALNPKQMAFIESADMFFLATADEHGQPTCSYKGGEPGFVRAIDDRTLAIPNYDGNGMYRSWGNALTNRRVGLLFIDFMKGWRLRIEGTATISADDPLIVKCLGAQFIVRIHVEYAYGNCPRYIHKYQLVERSPYVPREGCEAPTPEWKSREEFKKVLPKK